MRPYRFRFEQQVGDLPGRPDFVSPLRGVVIFIDGDFWHGWRFPAWAHKLDPRWQEKIAANRRRDRRNHQCLRRAGWTVIRIWEHELARSPDRVAIRVLAALRARD